jgi:ABC-type glutathione transport system ATPase component
LITLTPSGLPDSRSSHHTTGYEESILNARDEMEETFIAFSPDMDFVRDTCDRVARMRGGKIIRIGNGRYACGSS